MKAHILLPYLTKFCKVEVELKLSVAGPSGQLDFLFLFVDQSAT